MDLAASAAVDSATGLGRVAEEGAVVGRSGLTGLSLLASAAVGKTALRVAMPSGGRHLALHMRATSEWLAPPWILSPLRVTACSGGGHLEKRREPLVITQHGEAKAVLQDVASYEETQEALALLKVLALGSREVEEGRVRPLADAVDEIRSQADTAPSRAG